MPLLVVLEILSMDSAPPVLGTCYKAESSSEISRRMKELSAGYTSAFIWLETVVVSPGYVPSPMLAGKKWFLTDLWTWGTGE
jgi:hypothetical protein